jgi:hypothetical protein
MANRAVIAEIEQAGLSHLEENVLDHKTGSLKQKPVRSSVPAESVPAAQSQPAFVEEPLLVDVASHPILREDFPAPPPAPEKKRGGRPRKNPLPEVTSEVQSESV